MTDPTRRVLLAAGLLLVPVSAWAQGATRSAISDADVAALLPGEFIWAPALAPDGPMVLLVSLTAQQAYVYRNGVRIGASTVSSGKKGKETPTGVFTILQKNAKHRSNLYNNAPMPYMQRLTWDGIALHAGNLPGYPASHGCVRLPMAFARALFDETATGMTVVVTRDALNPRQLDGGDLLAPVTSQGASLASAAAGQRLAASEAFRWQPQLAPSGPVTVLISSRDQRLMVMRNGKLIGRGRIRIPAGRVAGLHALQFTGFDDRGRTRWIYVGIPGQEQLKGRALDFSGADDLEISPDYLKLVRGVLAPGATLVITDEPILGGGAGKPMTVIDAD